MIILFRHWLRHYGITWDGASPFQRQCANLLPTIWLPFTLRGTSNISQIFAAGHVIISFLALQAICQHRRSLTTQIVEEPLTQRRAMWLTIHNHLKQKHKCFYNSQQVSFSSRRRVGGCTATSVFKHDKNKRKNGRFRRIMANFEPENIH